jgi:hypothetical protein
MRAARLMSCLLLALLAGAVATAGAFEASPATEYSSLASQIAAAAGWNRERLAREVCRGEALILASDRTPVDVVLRRTRALLEDLRAMPSAPDLTPDDAALRTLEAEAASIVAGDEPLTRDLFNRLVALRRRIAFQNPLLDFDSIVFLKHNKQVRGERHMMDQYFGFNAERRGGVYVLDRPFGDTPSVRSLLADAPVIAGRLKGQVLEDRGAFISLDLDYDGRSILFAFSETGSDQPPGGAAETNYWRAVDLRQRGPPEQPFYHFRPETCYHVFKAGIDGSRLTQLTDGPWLDFDPCFLPNGRIAFISSRIGGQCRCGGRPDPTYTLHAMMADGSDIIPLSWHDTNEWHPSIDHDGMIVYTRWDYVDRDSDVAHHPWRSFPDGRNPRSLHGNYPRAREDRPWMELHLRAVPGSRKYCGVAAPHHGQAYGSIVLIDPVREDDSACAQVRRVTPEAWFPESESAPGVPHSKGRQTPAGEFYGSPWPLSENYFLCVHDEGQQRYAICLADSFGNREVLYRDPDVACLDPIPLRPRPRPPVIPVATAQAAADRGSAPLPDVGTIAVMNVYDSRRPLPPGMRIKELRVVALFPKDSAIADVPPVGAAAQSLCRGVLGTAPVEADGSAHFVMPAGMDVYFQLIGEDGLMVQNMRSATYVHPGETLTCAGCHESAGRSPDTRGGNTPRALRRAPSPLAPGPAGSFPITFPRLVQPVLDRHCVACHEDRRTEGKKAPGLRGDIFAENGWSQAFASLRRYAWGRSGGNGVALSERQYSVPGEEGARASKLYALLSRGHHDVALPDEDLRRITLWLDANSNFYGAYHEPERQAAGDLVQPALGIPPWIDFDLLAK